MDDPGLIFFEEVRFKNIKMDAESRRADILAIRQNSH